MDAAPACRRTRARRKGPGQLCGAPESLAQQAIADSIGLSLSAYRVLDAFGVPALFFEILKRCFGLSQGSQEPTCCV
eukprot:1097258-Alexandrium_andersonii.AAC.1